MVTKKEEAKIKDEIAEITEQLKEIAKGHNVKVDEEDEVQPAPVETAPPAPTEQPTTPAAEPAPAPVESVDVCDVLKDDLKANRGNVMVAFLDGDEVSVIHLNKDNLNNADFVKRLMGG